LSLTAQGEIKVTTWDQYQKDVVWTAAGELEMVFLGHGSLLFLFGGKTIYVDPFSRVADYAALPKADLVLITHEHRDHLDPEALASIRTDRTAVVLSESCAAQVEGGIVMRNGQTRTVAGVQVEAVPAYNLIHRRENGEPYHPPGVGNGYIVRLSDKRVYVAGDTENIPEMKRLRGIDIAFLPMNLPYTMTPEMVADAAKAFRPRILYPYHFGSTDTSRLTTLLEDEGGIEVRIRELA
jgi:L-ascorbate metabolism protein UlaG (beta-lactamase superfamily)